MTQQPYKVLATKYRPDNFAKLIGQDTLVRTLTNAINTNRIANAFLLTGIRGVGKTTTARIIARVLNCIGENGKGGATPTPCGVCANCKAIKEDRHPDVMEMDAASRTGVDNIREIIDSVKYLPTMARYKIYIIDEVHMLSKNAFNALLKTLEEPPAHVKFIFATTEIRKIPVTILSRCQRFDLRRIDNEVMTAHLAKIAKDENADMEEEALSLIANASEGSVRDALSLLDQAISHSDGKITAEMTRNMLGLADNSRIIDLFDQVAGGNTAKALATFKQLYDNGADAILITQDLLEFTYLVTKIKIIPNINLSGQIPQNELARAKGLAEKLAMSYLTRCWQMLLKGLSEAQTAHNSFIAVEMLLVRLAYMSELPSPAAIISKFQESGHTTATPVANSPAPSGFARTTANATATVAAPAYIREEEPVASINSFPEMVELFREKGEILLHSWLEHDVSLIKFEQGRIEFCPSEEVAPDFAGRISSCLKQWTGRNWIAVISRSQGTPTISKQKEIEAEKLKISLTNEPNVKKILELFPGSYIKSVEEE